MFKNNSRGQVAFFLLFLFIAGIVLVIGSIAAPFGATLATEFYGAGEDLLLDTQSGAVANIQDSEVREALNSSFQAATDSATTNISVATSLYQYSWLIVLILASVALYLITRRTIAFRQVV